MEIQGGIDCFDSKVERIKVQSIWFQALHAFGSWGRGDCADYSNYGRLFERIFENGAYEFDNFDTQLVVRSFKLYADLPSDLKFYYQNLRQLLALYLVRAGILPDIDSFADSPLDRILLISVFSPASDFGKIEARNGLGSTVEPILNSVSMDVRGVRI